MTMNQAKPDYDRHDGTEDDGTTSRHGYEVDEDVVQICMNSAQADRVAKLLNEAVGRKHGKDAPHSFRVESRYDPIKRKYPWCVVRVQGGCYAIV